MKSSQSWFSFAVLTAATALPVFAGSAPPQAKSAPVPVQVVSPVAIPKWAENSVVKLSLTIDANGVPQHVRAAEWMPSELSYRVVSAVEQWRFKPMYVDGRPVAANVILPLRLVHGQAVAVERVASTAHNKGDRGMR